MKGRIFKHSFGRWGVCREGRNVYVLRDGVCVFELREATWEEYASVLAQIREMSEKFSDEV